MAIIQCENCGKEVSDRAKACPSCGAKLAAEDSEVVSTVICEECGMELQDDLDACPQCGCPVPKVIPTQDPQKVEVTSVNLQMKKSTKKFAIIGVAAVVIIAALILIISGVRKAQEAKAAAEAEQRYGSNLESATVLMLTGAADAEGAGNLIKSVWYNAIHEERDSKTDKYTRPNGWSFVDDFNEALGNLFSDPNFLSTISDIESNQESVAQIMKQLKNPPETYEEAYDAIKDLYDAYLELTNLAINPTGSYNTFSSNFNDADSAVLKYYNAMDIYIQ